MFRYLRMSMLALVVGLGFPPAGHAQVDLDPSSESDVPSQPRGRLVLRFLTDSDYPPFNFLDDEGILAGFNVDLARAICLEMSVACDIQLRPWEELLAALARGEADAVIAGHTISAGALRTVDFTDQYMMTPARFAGPRGKAIEIRPDVLDEQRIGVARATAHEAFARAFFKDSRIESFATPELARDALMEGKIDLVFDDGIGLSFWLNGTASRACCEFKGGPYFEPKYFGDGLAIAVPKTDPGLRRQLNAALKRVREGGRYEELMHRYFASRIY